MIPDHKLVKIAEGLLDKTKREKLTWLRKDREPKDSPEYILKVPKSSKIQIRFQVPKVDPDYYELLVTADDGRLVGKFVAEENSEYWNLLSELYSEVDMQQSGLGDVLRDVEAFLSQP